MSEKEKCLMVIVPKQDVEDTLKDAFNNGNIERGVLVRSKIGKEIFEEFNKLKQRGYFPVGINIEDGFNLEFLFQRHPKQTKEMRYVEHKTPKELKYKL